MIVGLSLNAARCVGKALSVEVVWLDKVGVSAGPQMTACLPDDAVGKMGLPGFIRSSAFCSSVLRPFPECEPQKTVFSDGREWMISCAGHSRMIFSRLPANCSRLPMNCSASEAGLCRFGRLTISGCSRNCPALEPNCASLCRPSRKFRGICSCRKTVRGRVLTRSKLS